jgi:hypothetical protein
MTTLRSSVQSHHASGQQADTAPGAANDPVTAMVQEQLATLESLTAEGRTQIAELQNEVADLSVRLQQAQARLGTLSALLLAHERVLHTLHTGITAGAASTAPVTAESPQPPPTVPVAPAATAAAAAEPADEAPARQEPAVAEAVATQATPSHASPEMSAVSVRLAAAAEPSIPESRSGSAPEQSPAPEPEQHLAPEAPQPDAVYSRAAPSATAELPVDRGDVQHRPAAGRSKPTGNGYVNGSGKIVQRGSRVEIVFDDEPEEMTETYTIVHSSDANPTQKLIAENSPLGSALLGARPGEVRHFRVRSGPDQTVHVRSVN